MKNHRRLSLRAEALGELTPGDLVQLAGAAPTLQTCLDCPTPTTIKLTGECPTRPVNQCLISLWC